MPGQGARVSGRAGTWRPLPPPAAVVLCAFVESIQKEGLPRSD